MEFYIKKNSTLPVMKMEIVKDGRSDFNLDSFLSGQTTFLLSLYNRNEDKFVFASKQCFLTSEFSIFENKTKYYLNYQFSNRDTKQIGRFEVQISIPSNEGVILFPLEDKYFVNVVDSFATEYVDYNSLYVSDPPCCAFSETFSFGELQLSAYYNSGSLLVDYVLTRPNQVNYPTTVYFTNTLGVIIGENIVINSSVTIIAGQIAGVTQLILNDVDFNNLNQISFFSKVQIITSNQNEILNLSGNSFFSTPAPSQEFLVTQTPTPTKTQTPTATNTQTPTVTPTLTSTPTPTPSVTSTQNLIPTPTPSVTPTLTSTPTPTPSVTSTQNLTPTSTPTMTLTPSSTSQIEQNINDAILISPDLGYINVGGNLYLKFIDPINLIDPILTNDTDYILVGDSVYLKYIEPSPIPQPSPTTTPTVTPTPSVTSTITPSVTQTLTPSPTTEPLYPLTLYIQPMSGGQAIIFDGVTYTAETTVNIQLNTFYNIESVPIAGYMFVGWNIYGGSFSSTGQSTTVAISLTSAANLAPSYAEDPNYDALEAQLSSNLVNYQNAEDNNWVSITQQEYNNIFNNVDAVIKIGNSDEQVNTRDTATGWDTTTFGTIDANTPLTIPTGYYVVGFVAESWNQNGQVELGYTTTYHTGAPTYMGNSPNVIGGMTMFYVRKRPGNVEGAPASTNLYPVLNFIPPAYPNAVLNTFGWYTNDGGVNWVETVSAYQTAKIQILLTNTRSWPLPPLPSPTPTNTPSPTITSTETPTPTPTPTQTPLPTCYTVRQYLYGYDPFNGANGGLYVLDADYPNVVNIPAGAKATINSTLVTVTTVSSSNSAYFQGNPGHIVYFTPSAGNIFAGTFIEFCWFA